MDTNKHCGGTTITVVTEGGDKGNETTDPDNTELSSALISHAIIGLILFLIVK